MTRNEYPGVESPRYVGTPSHASLTGAFSASVGRSRVGNGVSVSVATGVFVGAGVNVSVGGSGVGEWISPPNGSSTDSLVAAGASVAAGACVAAGAAPPQDVKNKDKIRINMIR